MSVIVFVSQMINMTTWGAKTLIVILFSDHVGACVFCKQWRGFSEEQASKDESTLEKKNNHMFSFTLLDFFILRLLFDALGIGEFPFKAAHVFSSKASGSVKLQHKLSSFGKKAQMEKGNSFLSWLFRENGVHLCKVMSFFPDIDVHGH